jgi:hypothetical protein
LPLGAIKEIFEEYNLILLRLGNKCLLDEGIGLEDNEG